jgi:hypothetical protein
VRGGGGCRMRDPDEQQTDQRTCEVGAKMVC